MRSDDQAALHAFVESGRTALFRSAYLLCGDRHEAEDLDSTGFEAATAQGPLLRTPPLTRAQLRTLTLSPELLPEK